MANIERSAGICFGLSIVWLLLAQLFTGFIVWSTLLGSFLSTGLIAAFFLYNYYLVFVLGGEALVTGDVTLDTQLYNQYFLLSIGNLIKDSLRQGLLLL
jgi:hypothetical protein